MADRISSGGKWLSNEKMAEHFSKMTEFTVAVKNG
jgi:hypothetical protein